VVAGHHRGARVGVDAGRAELDADPDRAARLGLVEPRHERLPVRLERQLPLTVLAEPDDRDVQRRVLARGPRGRHARRQPGRGGVRAPAHVAADDAEPRPDRRDHALAHARDRRDGGGCREQRADDEKDRHVLRRRLAAIVHTGS
jgi:hypothetical protein